jgi:RHS repeat-associated protein
MPTTASAQTPTTPTVTRSIPSAQLTLTTSKITYSPIGVTIVYDGDGNRVSETVGSVTTNYLVDTINPTGYAQVVDELQNGAVGRTYSYGLERISEKQLTGISFYGYDGHGSVRQLTNTSGTVTDTYDYDAFGNPVNSTGSTPNNYLFAGEQYDPALSLYYNRARYLNSTTGRFWSMDALEGSVFEPRTLHRYLYASDSPVDRVDPSGNEDADIAENLSTAADLVVVAAISVVTLGYVCLAYAQTTGGGPCGEGPNEGSMRIQLQLGDQFTVPGTPILNNPDPPGVTSFQVREGLEEIYAIAQTSAAKFPFNSLQSDLVTAVIIVSQQAGMFAPYGYSGFKRSLLTSPIGRSGWRIDVDNLEGTNLRQ